MEMIHLLTLEVNVMLISSLPCTFPTVFQLRCQDVAVPLVPNSTQWRLYSFRANSKQALV